MPTSGSTRRGLLPPLCGGIVRYEELPVLPIPSSPAQCREETSSTWSSDDRRKIQRHLAPYHGASPWERADTGAGNWELGAGWETSQGNPLAEYAWGWGLGAAQDGSEIAPSWPPRWPKVAPKMAQDRPKTPHAIIKRVKGTLWLSMHAQWRFRV